MTDGKSFNERIIDEFRSNDGKVGGPFEGATMLILSTTGAKTGRALETPLVTTPASDRWLVYASAAGAPKHPSWYHNLIANPDVTVEVGTETFPATARVITGGQRDRLWAEQVERAPGFGEYQAQTSRLIPVVELRRRNG